MKKVVKTPKTAVTVTMTVEMFNNLFFDAVDKCEKEGKLISVPEIIRRIIKKHYKK